MTKASYITRYYHGCKVTATKIQTDFKHPYPYVFSVEHEGVEHNYRGIPNQCKTAASALRRGWWRAKWLAEGTYSEHYQSIGSNSPD